MGLGAATLSFTVLEPEALPAPQHPRWAVLGRSNVGKSSFLNALIHPQTLFRTGRTPGVTRGLIGAQVQLKGQSGRLSGVLELVDLPGFGFAKGADNARWQGLAEALRDQATAQPLHWIWLVDPQREPAQEERLLSQWLQGEPYSVIFTKADKLRARERQAALKNWNFVLEGSTEKALFASSLRGEGLDEVQKMARAFVRHAQERPRT